MTIRGSSAPRSSAASCPAISSTCPSVSVASRGCPCWNWICAMFWRMWPSRPRRAADARSPASAASTSSRARRQASRASSRRPFIRMSTTAWPLRVKASSSWYCGSPGWDRSSSSHSAIAAPVLIDGLGGRADVGGDPGQPAPGPRQLGAERRVAGALGQELLVEPLRVLEQLLAQRVQPRLVEQPLLGDPGEELVHGLPRLRATTPRRGRARGAPAPGPRWSRRSRPPGPASPRPPPRPPPRAPARTGRRGRPSNRPAPAPAGRRGGGAGRRRAPRPRHTAAPAPCASPSARSCRGRRPGPASARPGWSPGPRRPPRGPARRRGPPPVPGRLGRGRSRGQRGGRLARRRGRSQAGRCGLRGPAPGPPDDRRAGPLGRLLADGLEDLGGRPRLEPIGPAAGQELVEHHAQRVDVAGRRDRLALDLLGAGVFRRQHQLAAAGQARPPRRARRCRRPPRRRRRSAWRSRSRSAWARRRR